MLPIDTKELLRTFFKRKIELSKQKSLGTIPALLVKEADLEQFLDKLWVQLNTHLMNHDDV
jgi:hypothetical protein